MKVLLVLFVLHSLAASQTPPTHVLTYENDLPPIADFSGRDFGKIVVNKISIRIYQGNSIIRNSYWIIGFFVITGNAYVIVGSFVRTSCFKQAWPSVSLQCNHIVILNIAVADLIMGIYLISISIMNVTDDPSVAQGIVACHILQCLTVISSEASCLLMVTLTSFRLYYIYRPLSSITASKWPWIVCIVMSWFIAVFLGLFAMAFDTYFIGYDYNLWQFSTPNTSLCFPSFFSFGSYRPWKYFIALISLNFICFIFIAVGYVLIGIHSTKKRPIHAASTADLRKREAKMQRRIARIIITDCICWVPICIMAYAVIGGWKPEYIIYEITAGFLLPINSALNPFLYSISLSKLFKRFGCRPIKRCRK